MPCVFGEELDYQSRLYAVIFYIFVFMPEVISTTWTYHLIHDKSYSLYWFFAGGLSEHPPNVGKSAVLVGCLCWGDVGWGAFALWRRPQENGKKERSERRIRREIDVCGFGPLLLL